MTAFQSVSSALFIPQIVMTVVVAFILEAFLFRMQYRQKMHGLDMDGTLSLVCLPSKKEKCDKQ